MADGDTMRVPGGIRISIDKASAASTVSLITPSAGKKLAIHEMELTFDASSKVEFIEETSGDSLLGPFDPGAAFSVNRTFADSPVKTLVAGKALQVSRGSACKITGSMVYTETD